MFDAIDMTPKGLYRAIERECEGRYDTLEYIEQSQTKHVIKLTRKQKLDIYVVCDNPQNKLVKFEHAMSTIEHIKDEYEEREIIWWL